MGQPTLYERIGGAFAIAAVIDHFSDAVVRNPKTGQKVHVPSRRTPYFTVGKELRERLNPLQHEPVIARPGNYSSIGASAVQPLAAASESAPRYPIR